MAGTNNGDDHDGIREEETSSWRDNNEKTKTETQMKMKKKTRKNPSVISLAMARSASYPAGVSSMDSKELIQGLHKGVLLDLDDHKVKFWVDDSLHRNCFMLFAKGLNFKSGDWSWEDHYQEDCLVGPVVIALASLCGVTGLDISGKLPSSLLSPMTTYEVVFVFKMNQEAEGWDLHPVHLGLTQLPNKTTVNRTEDSGKKPKGQWLEIPFGEINPDHFTRYVEFSINHYASSTSIKKKGLIVKGIIFRPKY